MSFIDAHEFVGERSNEIQELEKSLPSRRKKNMLFQKLPFYMRRRSASHYRKRKRNKKSDYYGKRFSMIHVNGHKIAHKRFEKTFSLLHKGGNYIYNMVHYHGYVYRIDYGVEQELKNYKYHDIDASINRKELNDDRSCGQGRYYTSNGDAHFTLHFNDEGKFHLFKTKKTLILVTASVVPEFLQAKEILCETESIFEVLKEKELSRSGVYKLTNGTITKSDVMIDDYFSSIQEDHVVKLNAEFSLVLIFSNLKKIFGNIIRVWTIIGLEEYMKLSLDYGFFVFPFDDVNSDWYKQYEKEVFYEENQKYFRTPRGKRYDYLALKENDNSKMSPCPANQTITKERDTQSNIFIFPYKFPCALKSQFTYLFKCDKGNLQRCARVYRMGDESVVCGYVLRGSFCYSVGKYRGIVVLWEAWDDSQAYFGMNIRSSQKYSLVKIS